MTTTVKIHVNGRYRATVVQTNADGVKASPIVVEGNSAIDGGRARIMDRRVVLGISDPDRFHFADSLVMDHADNGMPSDSAYHAAENDSA